MRQKSSKEGITRHSTLSVLTAKVDIKSSASNSCRALGNQGYSTLHVQRKI